ncbi:hypothetical protein MPDQ_005573 [Monascus purpureus]|uniref:Uncharacterized protein n=1 Tax=Monascus purpureus TaxID=5098 RepID=A0A507R6V7_MONPU|nr:hypothetical protein MPDQ_005573 [Monascus purpureus]
MSASELHLLKPTGQHSANDHTARESTDNSKPTKEPTNDAANSDSTAKESTANESTANESTANSKPTANEPTANQRTILEVFRTTSKFAVHHLSWETEDPLLNDAKINKSCAHETLRNVLGSLILADQYTKWEIQNGKKPRVDVLLADLGSGNRNSRYKDYINTKPSMQNKDRGRRFLEYGVKYRVFGHLFAAHAGNGSIFPRIDNLRETKRKFDHADDVAAQNKSQRTHEPADEEVDLPGFISLVNPIEFPYIVDPLAQYCSMNSAVDPLVPPHLPSIPDGPSPGVLSSSEIDTALAQMMASDFGGPSSYDIPPSATPTP